MNEPITSREFTNVLKRMGFKKQKHTYARVCGDGILQVVSTAQRYYISIESPYYSSSNRKSNSITFGFSSLYSPLEEFYFEPDVGGTFFSPWNLYGHGRLYEFQGIQDDYQKFLEKGLDILEATKTQRALLENFEHLYSISCGALRGRTDLCAPCLICGEQEKALGLIEARYFQNMDAAFVNADRFVEPGDNKEYLDWINKTRNNLQPYVDLFYDVVIGRKHKVEAFFRENYQRNMEYVEKYNIPVVEGYAPLFD